MEFFFNNFQIFVNEQQEYFQNHLSQDFAHEWNEDFWYIGTHGTGWLQGTGKGTLLFDTINKSTKGFDTEITIDSEDYKNFMKAMVIASYRKKRNISTTVAVASVLILKRWYHSLVLLTGQNHPVYLTTDVLKDAMHKYQLASKIGDPNVADTLGRCLRLQKLANHYAFCLSPLRFENNVNYTNTTNYTKKAKEIQNLKKNHILDDDEVTDKSKLITISTFLNIVALINKCETVGEKILLNLVLLLIVTGFRSIEAITLRKDALVRRDITDLVTREKLISNGSALYFLGIKYVGAKHSGKRIHWVEPLAIPLVEAIFSTVIELTAYLREHLTYLRDKNFSSYLPKEIYDSPSDLIELDDIDTFIVGTSSEYRGKGGKREKTYKALSKAGVNPVMGEGLERRESKVYYRKLDLSQYIADNFRNNKKQIKEPCTFIWKSKNKQHKEYYEDLLFIHEYRSTNLARLLVNKANPIPFDNLNINNFLGSGRAKSVFEKYNLTEADGDFSSLTSHIPRHNINTFLAIADISDHLQAMLMGRTDISQNEYYKHIAIAQRRKVASMYTYGTQLLANEENSEDINDKLRCLTPLDTIKETGLLRSSKNLSVENNIRANLHTFDGKDDIADFMEESFMDGVFGDIKEAFNELKETEGNQAAKELINRHAQLHPLALGSCTYNIALWGCSYRLKCQSGEACSYFTLTGRADEINRLYALKKSLIKNLFKIKDMHTDDANFDSLIEDITNKLKNVDLLETKAKEALTHKGFISIYEELTDSNGCQNITTLADLFALEYINQQAEIQ